MLKIDASRAFGMVCFSRVNLSFVCHWVLTNGVHTIIGVVCGVYTCWGLFVEYFFLCGIYDGSDRI